MGLWPSSLDCLRIMRTSYFKERTALVKQKDNVGTWDGKVKVKYILIRILDIIVNAYTQFL